MELRDLRYFCMTAELEHVTKAADKLGVAQPYLTKVIGQIEEMKRHRQPAQQHDEKGAQRKRRRAFEQQEDHMTPLHSPRCPRHPW